MRVDVDLMKKPRFTQRAFSRLVSSGDQDGSQPGEGTSQAVRWDKAVTVEE